MRAGLTFAGTVRRGAFTLDAVLDVASGEVLALLGPNGAGKTTLLRAVAGLEPMTGSLRVAGQGWIGRAAETRPVGYAFQEHRLFPHLDVRDNVAFGVRTRARARGPARQVATDWLDRLGLADLAGRRPHQLSGGQAQKVALTRALAREPEVLLLDEPMAALDVSTRGEVRDFLRRHLGLVEGPTLLVTHDPLEAMLLADRIAILEDGAITQLDTAAEISRRPVSPYVAQLVGLNLYSGTLDASGTDPGGRVALDAGGTLIGLVSPDVSREAASRVSVTLRPSAIALHTSRPGEGSPRNVWAGTVVDLQPLGDRVRVRVSGEPEALVELTPLSVAELEVRPGARVWLSAKATEVSVFAGGAERGLD